MPFRLIAADLDGTLLLTDGTVSERTRGVLARLNAAGITTVVVTARPPRRVRQIADAGGFGGLAICANGALVYDIDAHALVEQRALEADAARALVHALRAAVPGICFATEAGLVYGQEPAYASVRPHIDDIDPVLDDAIGLCASGVTKLIALHPTWPVDDLLRVTLDLAGEAATVTHSGAPFVEIAAPGITKASALAALSLRLGIAPADVLAFGDMPNDLPMLAWAGHSVAVANAHPEVLAAASEVTRSNDEDGVALVLERVLGADLDR